MAGTAIVRVAFLTASVFAVALVVSANAQSPRDPPDTPAETASRRESLTLLRQARFDALDRKMNGLQRAYELGQLEDESLLHHFRAFYDTTADLELRYNAWIAAYPNSYAARLARGIYYRYLGLQARGTRYISETSPQQLELMSGYMAKAMPDYEESLRLTTKPLLSYHAILAVAMLEGNDELSKAMLAESLRIDPKNFVVRYKYFVALQTRWGGSLKQMLDFSAKARAAGLSEAQLVYFENMIGIERQWLKAHPR